MGELHRIAGWAFVVLLGPINFAGTIGGPSGEFDGRYIAAAVLGTLLWMLVGFRVIRYV